MARTMYGSINSIQLSTEGTRPSDSYAHQKFNADHQSVATNNIALGMIKTNDTVVAQAMALASITSYLQGEVANGYLQPKSVADSSGPADPGFYIDISIDMANPFQIDKNMKIRPIGAVYMIQDNEIIQAPVTGAAASSQPKEDHNMAVFLEFELTSYRS